MKSVCLILLILLSVAHSQIVCSEDELIREIMEDIAYNGKLDCLRHSTPPDEQTETEEERQLRLAAEWNSDCSFEALSENWVEQFIKDYDLQKGLVDVHGTPFQHNFPDQADMCEIVRSLVANGKFPGISGDVSNVPLSIINYINCPGETTQTKVCAVNSGSFAYKPGWYILLQPRTLTVADEPQFHLINHIKK